MTRKEEWIVSFVEQTTYLHGDERDGWRGGRIELIPLHGDIERDKFEIGTILLPAEDWERLRKNHHGKRFGVPLPKSNP